jgi:hypothetical protein
MQKEYDFIIDVWLPGQGELQQPDPEVAIFNLRALRTFLRGFIMENQNSNLECDIALTADTKAHNGLSVYAPIGTGQYRLRDGRLQVIEETGILVDILTNIGL